MTSKVFIEFDTSDLSPQTSDHIEFVITEELRQKGIRFERAWSEVTSDNAK